MFTFLKKYITKADIVLLAALIAFGLAAAYISVRPRGEGACVRITVNGELYGTYPLTDDRTVVIEQNGHHNEVQIHGGTARMLYSDCKNQICVNTGAISGTNQTIVCLPNRVLVEIIGGEEEFDVITK